MRLVELEKYDKITIQCHNNPDPDSIAAGYGLYKYFESKGKEVRLVYSGNLLITKPNILMFIEALAIPIEYVDELKVEGLLITVDCQHGAGNVKYFEAEHVAIIDHHIQEVPVIELQEIRSYLASSATLVWDMMSQEGYDFNKSPDVSTALYYGLFTDSSSFIEISHPLDKDLRDSLKYDKHLLRRLRNAVLTLKELEIAGMALIRHSYNDTYKYAVIKAQQCDPNILGLISDFVLQVDSVNVCIVYNEASEGIKFSVRSCVKEVMANELASYLAEDLGSGGGHVVRAAGFISKTRFSELYGHLNHDEYFLRKLTEYYQSFEVIDVTTMEIRLDEFKQYKKIPAPMGFVTLRDLLAEGTPIVIRSMELDIERDVKDTDILVIDKEGNVSVIDEERFNLNCKATEELFDIKIDYFPRIRRQNGEGVIYLESYVKKCIAKEESIIYAKPLEKSVKLFTVYSPDQYKNGNVGDYLVINEKDKKNVYVIGQDAFNKNYIQI